MAWWNQGNYGVKRNSYIRNKELSSLWWKYRHYADDDTTAKAEGKVALQLNFMKELNRKAHRTDKYGVKNLIVRRGEEFKLTLDVNRSFDKDTDRLQFIFSLGNYPQESKGSLLRVDVHKDKASADKDNYGNWKGYIDSINGKTSGSTINVVILTSPDALVGKYTVQTNVFGAYNDEEKKKFSKDEDEELYVLFNAWCKDDQVYLEKEDDRQEYVLNETGRIWVGTAANNGGTPWNFGQFGSACLNGAMYLLEYSPPQTLGNATLVCRDISAMANSYTSGVLTGRWQGPYSDGTHPTAWNGSQAIMEEFMTTKRPVKYGQCWVFSGLVTTLGRTLGIPVRSVTNFESAHDKDASMTIDFHFSNTGKDVSGMNDSIWNFHVWNEAWMQRPDLPDGYDGWQAFDATPQELSQGDMKCGPAPVKAIKEGNVYLGYDTKFVFGEVNGDRMNWIVESNGDMYMLVEETETSAVGKSISTKKVGSIEKNDVTGHYKYPEGSAEERQAVKKALRFSSRKENLAPKYKMKNQDVKFDYKGETLTNADVEIVLEVENTSSEMRNVSMKLTLNAAYYTGATAQELSNEKLEIVLEGSEKQRKSWIVKAENYLNLIEDDAKLKMTLVASVKETRQMFTKQDIFNVKKPDLELEASTNKPNVGKEFEVTLKFTNEISVKLTGGVFRLEGPGIQKNLKIPIHRSIQPGETVSEKVKLKPKYDGKREIIANFNSRQITGITGATTVEVVR